jgi:hypothetical protein
MISQGILFKRFVLTVAAAMGQIIALHAASITVPNGSFASPATPLADPRVDIWQQIPDWAGTESGVFSNTPPLFIDNCDGTQVAFIFATPGTTLQLDYDSVDWIGTTHAFDAVYQPGQSYALTVGVLGGTNLSYPMAEGTTLQLGLYYRDATNGIVTIATTTITNSGALFPSATHLVDFQVNVPAVQASDAWAGKHIGIQLLSTTDGSLAGGYWDIDNVRLTSGPALTATAWTNGQFTLTLQSYPGTIFEILAAPAVTTPGSNWVSLGTVTNTTGTATFTDSAAAGTQRYYRAHQVP